MREHWRSRARSTSPTRTRLSTRPWCPSSTPRSLGTPGRIDQHRCARRLTGESPGAGADHDVFVNATHKRAKILLGDGTGLRILHQAPGAGTLRVSLKTVGLTVPLSLLLRADKVMG